MSIEQLPSPAQNQPETHHPRFDYDKFGLPQNTALDLFYEGHTTLKDIGEKDQLKQILKRADIFLYEMVDWSAKHIAQYQKISNGDYAEYRGRKEYYLSVRHLHKAALLDSLFDSRVQVVSPDLEYNHSLAEANYQIHNGAIPTPQDLLTLDFESALAKTRDYVEAFCSITSQREQHILERIPKGVEEAVNRKEKLRRIGRVGTLRVVMLTGTMHTSLGAALRTAAASEESEANNFSLAEHFGFRNDLYFDYYCQMYARYIRGQQIDDLILAKGMITFNILRYVRNLTVNGSHDYSTSEYYRILCKSVAGRPLEDLKIMFEELKNNKLPESLQPYLATS